MFAQKVGSSNLHNRPGPFQEAHKIPQFTQDEEGIKSYDYKPWLTVEISWHDIKDTMPEAVKIAVTNHVSNQF